MTDLDVAPTYSDFKIKEFQKKLNELDKSLKKFNLKITDKWNPKISNNTIMNN